MELDEIVKKLVGKIEPIGETNTDNDRFENLKVMCNLINELVRHVDDVGYRNKDAYEFSRKRVHEYVENFMSKTLGISE